MILKEVKVLENAFKHFYNYFKEMPNLNRLQVRSDNYLIKS